MRFYSNVCRIGNDICVREHTEYGPEKFKVKYQPKLYMSSDNPDSEYKTLYGDPVKVITQTSMSAAKEFVDEYSNVSGVKIYGQTDYVAAYMNERYPGKVKFDASRLSIWPLDIETRVPVDLDGNPSGFPSAENADAEIVLITMSSLQTGQCFTFASKPFNGTADTKYMYYSNEAELLKNFIAFWNQKNVEVVTGWNVEVFDIPFLVNRITKILGEEWAKRLSPWNSVSVGTKTVMGKKRVSVDIAGITILDYLELYKKFTYTRQESYSLAFISSAELGTSKLDHSEYKNFNDFIERGWDEKFVPYNVIDVKLINMLDAKLKLIDVALNVAYLAKVNFITVFGPVKTWDSIIHNALLDEKKVVPLKEMQGGVDGIEGAYVKEPIPGFKYWPVTLDAESLYPSNAIMLNMSPETYLGRNADIVMEDMLHGRVKAKNKNECLSPIGARFSKKEQGIIPRLFEGLKTERKVVKKEMLRLKQELELTKVESEKLKLTSEIAAKDNMQMALKIALNSAYGAVANKGFRFYNPNIAESITMLGQYALKLIESRIDDRLSEVFKLPPTKFLWYTDTDSVFFEMGAVVDKYMQGKTTDQIVKALEKIAVEILQVEIDKLMDEVAVTTNAYKKTLIFKLENVGTKALIISKKKYAIRVYSSEGVSYSKPKYKIMGMDIVKSSSPVFVRDKLRTAVDIIFDGTEQDIQKYVKEVRTEFNKLDIHQIAIPRGVNGLEEYGNTVTIYNKDKAVPINARAALLYNAGVKSKGLAGVYPLITSGSKIRYFYLKMPNPSRENIFGIPADDTLPKEFGLDKYVDYDLMFEKTMVSSIQHMLTAINWSAVELSNLDSMFE